MKSTKRIGSLPAMPVKGITKELDYLRANRPSNLSPWRKSTKTKKKK